MEKNFRQGWKTTLIGLILLLVDIYYLTEKNGSAMIFFGLLVVSFGLFFAPDDLIKAVKSLIKKNQDKQF
jgi:uncharacterized membrane protein